MLRLLFFSILTYSVFADNLFSEISVDTKASRNADNQVNCVDIGLNFLDGPGYVEDDDIFSNTTILEDDAHYCRFRDFQLYPEFLWNYLAGIQCLFFTSPHRISGTLPLFRCNYTAPNDVTYDIIYSLLNGSVVLFNHRNREHFNLLRPIFRTDAFFDRFVTCCQEAEYCCKNVMTAENVALSEENPCPATWDAWSCFLPADPGTTANVRCPPHSYSADVPCIIYAERHCLKEGGWYQDTDYTMCAAAPIFRRRTSFHITVLFISIALCLPAIILFFLLRKKPLRIILHRNLLLAIIVKNVLTIMSKWIVIWDSLVPESNNILENSPWGCKVLAYFETLSINVIFTWMLIEAYYLHKIIVRVFSQDPSLCTIYLVVAACSIVPSTVWAILMAGAEMELCWMVDTTTWYQWIGDGYRLAILAINTLLLADIIRVFISKIAQRASKSQIKSSVKVILFLTLLFGVPLIITSQRSLVDMDQCTIGDIYYYVVYSVEALQGIVIAVIFCYVNTAVHKDVRQKYQYLKLYFCGYSRSRQSKSTTVLTNDQLTSSFGSEVIPAKKIQE